MELYADGNGGFVSVWIPGKMLLKSRYHGKGERRKIINKAIEVFGEDLEIGILPDCIEEQEEEE